MADSSSDSQENAAAVDLYSILKLDRDASEEEIHRSYRTLSTTFHPDKLPPSDSSREEIQQTFLDLKSAHEVLIDPVLRLTYDHYGEEGVTLLKRLQLQQREQDARKEAAEELKEGEEGDEEEEEDEDAYNLYERLEQLLHAHNYGQAKEELRKFMEQHDYHENLSEENQVHLNLSMEFPPVINLKQLLYNGKKYLQYSEKRIRALPMTNENDKQYYQQRIVQERRLVDYQFTKIKDSQRGELGFTLSSTQPRNAGAMTGGTPIQPKWSMAMGASTQMVYPHVAKIMEMAGQKDENEHHPVSVFVNTAFQPIPQTQISLTANLSNDDSHQFVLGSAHTFANQTACRYNITLLSKSPLPTPLIFNFKTYRHLRNIGMATGGVSVGGDGDMLQWNAKWDAHRDNHKVSVKAGMGMLQGSSIEASYRVKFPRNHWLEELITMPKRLDVTAAWGRLQKVTAMVTQEFNSLATHPTLGFGMEHDISLGRWTWIWEFQYNDSTFRIPIPVLFLGSVSNGRAFYSRRLYHAIYCLMFQSMLADVLQDPDLTHSSSKKPSDEDLGAKKDLSPNMKTKKEAESQLRLMEPIAEKKHFLESQRKGGLAILYATYWCEIRGDDDTTSEFITMDATIQLRFWVSNGKLVGSSIPKSSWLGFYDLQAETCKHRPRFGFKLLEFVWKEWKKRQISNDRPAVEPRLTIRYRNKGKVYELTVGETEAFSLPCNEIAECLGDANIVT
jgi:hypothetical protein